MKFWNKWLRKTHRWLAIPLLILVPISIVLKVSGNGAIIASVPQWEAVQSLLILFLVISGGYLFFVPYWSKYKRKRRRSNGSSAVRKREIKDTGQ